MAAVTINSGEVDATDLLREVPSAKWRELMTVRRDYLSIRIASDCRRLLEFVEDAEQMYAPLGFTSSEDFIEHGLELDPQDVAWAVEGLRRLKPDEPIPYEKAKALGKHGGDRKSDVVKDQVGNTKLISKGGTTAPYILARLERDGHHELAAKVRSKTMSARAAAKAAGIVRELTALEQLRRWWKKASPDERSAFINEVT